MRKKITPVSIKNNHVEIQQKMVVAPSEMTLDFLKAFARSCRIEKSLPESLNRYSIN